MSTYRYGNGMSSLGSHWKPHQHGQEWATRPVSPSQLGAEQPGTPDSTSTRYWTLPWGWGWAEAGPSLGWPRARGWAGLGWAMGSWTSPTVASWGQGLMAPRDWCGVLCCGQEEEEISGKLGRHTQDPGLFQTYEHFNYSLICVAQPKAVTKTDAELLTQ